jgi:hypothetical protein
MVMLTALGVMIPNLKTAYADQLVKGADRAEHRRDPTPAEAARGMVQLDLAARPRRRSPLAHRFPTGSRSEA